MKSDAVSATRERRDWKTRLALAHSQPGKGLLLAPSEVHEVYAVINGQAATEGQQELLAALRKLPLDSFGEDIGQHDAAEFVDHAGEFFEAMVAARAVLAKYGQS